LKLVHKLSRNLFTVHVVNRLWRKVRYPGIGIADNVAMEIGGEFKYGDGCGIETGSNIIVPKGASLSLGEGCYVGRYVELGPGAKIEIGSHTSIQDRSIFVGDVYIGRYCLFSLNVLISSGRHYYDLHPYALIKDQDRFVSQNRAKVAAYSKPVVVEDDCWLGINTVVMPGVTIGKGAVVGANSVVTKDVAPYTVVAGVPAREIKKRLKFSPPRAINYDNPTDWPYFYSGFEVSEAARDQNAQHEGLAALSTFEVCLDTTLARSIHLVAKDMGQEACSLIFHGEKREINSQFREVVFDATGAGGTASRLRVQADTASAKLIIQKVWVQ